MIVDAKQLKIRFANTNNIEIGKRNTVFSLPAHWLPCNNFYLIFFKEFNRDSISASLSVSGVTMKSVRALLTEVPAIPFAVRVEITNGKLLRRMCVKFCPHELWPLCLFCKLCQQIPTRNAQMKLPVCEEISISQKRHNGESVTQVPGIDFQNKSWTWYTHKTLRRLQKELFLYLNFRETISSCKISHTHRRAQTHIHLTHFFIWGSKSSLVITFEEKKALENWLRFTKVTVFVFANNKFFFKNVIFHCRIDHFWKKLTFVTWPYNDYFHPFHTS